MCNCSFSEIECKVTKKNYYHQIFLPKFCFLGQKTYKKAYIHILFEQFYRGQTLYFLASIAISW